MKWRDRSGEQGSEQAKDNDGGEDERMRLKITM